VFLSNVEMLSDSRKWVSMVLENNAQVLFYLDFVCSFVFSSNKE